MQFQNSSKKTKKQKTKTKNKNKTICFSSYLLFFHFLHLFCLLYILMGQKLQKHKLNFPKLLNSPIYLIQKKIEKIEKRNFSALGNQIEKKMKIAKIAKIPFSKRRKKKNLF